MHFIYYESQFFASNSKHISHMFLIYSSANVSTDYFLFLHSLQYLEAHAWSVTAAYSLARGAAYYLCNRSITFNITCTLAPLRLVLDICPLQTDIQLLKLYNCYFVCPLHINTVISCLIHRPYKYLLLHYIVFTQVT